jgi:hypothetical protein
MTYPQGGITTYKIGEIFKKKEGKLKLRGHKAPAH